MTRPITPRATRFRGTNAPQISVRKITAPMERISSTDFSGPETWEPSQSVRHRTILLRPVRRGEESDRSEPRSDYDETPAMLGKAIILTIDNPLLGIIRKVETLVGKDAQEVVEDFMTLEFWDVLHADDIRLQLSHEPPEVLEQR